MVCAGWMFEGSFFSLSYLVCYKHVFMLLHNLISAAYQIVLVCSLKTDEHDGSINGLSSIC